MALSALSGVKLSVLGLGAVVLLATQNIDTRAQPQASASNARSTMTGNAITGEGLPNPAPVVTRNWGQLPTGRKWGTTAALTSIPSTATSGPTSAAAREPLAVVPSTATTHRSIPSSSSIGRPARYSRTSARASW